MVILYAVNFIDSIWIEKIEVVNKKNKYEKKKNNQRWNEHIQNSRI